MFFEERTRSLGVTPLSSKKDTFKLSDLMLPEWTDRNVSYVKFVYIFAWRWRPTRLHSNLITKLYT